MKPDQYPMPRYVIWNISTREILEVSAMDKEDAILRYGWGKERTVIISKGRKPALIAPIRLGLTSPTKERNPYDE